MKKLILASQSPRRRELLAQVGIEFEVQISQASEETDLTAPAEIVEELSKRKAQSVFILHPSDIVLGADTIVALGDKIYGKPETYGEAFDMISELAGHVHQVYTGVTLIVRDPDGSLRTRTFHECTDVDVCEMTPEEVEAYISTEEPYDKAGAYGIQGSFGIYIRAIRGCYYNVVGLPISRLYQEMKKLTK